MVADFDVFNGDADGICALLQLRRQRSVDSELVTGVKRDIALLERVSAGPGDRVTALDISLDKNRVPLIALLERGVDVFYVDHHYAGEIPDYAGLTPLIDTAPEVGTCALVNRHLKGTQAAWAVVGTYGDNLDGTAEQIAASAGLTLDMPACKELGILINYNAYGATVDDLHIAPDALFRRLLDFDGPMSVIHEDKALVSKLSEGYSSDMEQAAAATRLVEDDQLAVMTLPDAPWARRVSGVYGNELANTWPDRAHAILTELGDAYMVSVRAPLKNRTGADEVCRQFATGGGRAAAAGINSLPASDVGAFVDRLRQQYG